MALQLITLTAQETKDKTDQRKNKTKQEVIIEIKNFFNRQFGEASSYESFHSVECSDYKSTKEAAQELIDYYSNLGYKCWTEHTYGTKHIWVHISWKNPLINKPTRWWFTWIAFGFDHLPVFGAILGSIIGSFVGWYYSEYYLKPRFYQNNQIPIVTPQSTEKQQSPIVENLEKTNK